MTWIRINDIRDVKAGDIITSRSTGVGYRVKKVTSGLNAPCRNSLLYIEIVRPDPMPFTDYLDSALYFNNADFGYAEHQVKTIDLPKSIYGSYDAQYTPKAFMTQLGHPVFYSGDKDMHWLCSTDSFLESISWGELVQRLGEKHFPLKEMVAFTVTGLEMVDDKNE